MRRHLRIRTYALQEDRMDCAAVHNASQGHTALYLWPAHCEFYRSTADEPSKKDSGAVYRGKETSHRFVGESAQSGEVAQVFTDTRHPHLELKGRDDGHQVRVPRSLSYPVHGTLRIVGVTSTYTGASVDLEIHRCGHDGQE